MAHAATYDNEKMIWIEGIRVHENFRKHGIAQKMIAHFEDYARKQGFEISRMLIASENIPSLTLAQKLGYQKISKWNYFSLESKEFTQEFDVSMENCLSDNQLIDDKFHFIESWRWIPMTRNRLDTLNFENKILCKKINNQTISMGIVTESQSFENTIILELLIANDIEDIIKFPQNLA